MVVVCFNVHDIISIISLAHVQTLNLDGCMLLLSFSTEEGCWIVAETFGFKTRVLNKSHYAYGMSIPVADPEGIQGCTGTPL